MARYGIGKDVEGDNKGILDLDDRNVWYLDPVAKISSMGPGFRI